MKKILIGLTVASLALTSCGEWLDINYDPNSPTAGVVDNNMILPASEMALSAKYGDFFRIAGGYFAQHYSQMFGTSNYLDYSRFTMSATQSSSSYSTIMANSIANAAVVREKAAEAEEWGSYLAATCIRVFGYQALVDAYGEIPYTEGQDPSILNPAYDDGATVYAGLVEELDEALSKVSETDIVATNFLYAGQNASNWIKFANALKFKILMRESGVVNVSSQLAALVSENNFPTADVAWKNIWANESGKANPFYQEEFATYFGSTQINLSLNVALYRAMSDYDDARMAAFFSPNNSDGSYIGGISGTNLSTSSNYSANSFCRPAAHYDDPVYLISKAEIEFFLAEYYAGAGNNTQAQAHYEAAIRASFETAGVSGAEAAIAAWPFDAQNVQKCIGVQKWIALSGINGFEAWCEMRRLGYPRFGGLSASDIYSDDNIDASVLTPGELYTPESCNAQVGANATIQRWPYALSSSSYNSNAPANKSLSDKVFWAK